MQFKLPSMYLVKLKKEERRIIKKIAKIQLASLRMLLENACDDVDITTYALKHGFKESELNESINKEIREFEEVVKDPRNIFLLDEDNMSISKSIMVKYIRKVELEEAKKTLWKKLIVAERYPLNVN